MPLRNIICIVELVTVLGGIPVIVKTLMRLPLEGLSKRQIKQMMVSWKSFMANLGLMESALMFLLCIMKAGTYVAISALVSLTTF